jgi:hypothetical protein
MARQVIDLRTEEEKRGVTGLQKASQAIADLLLTLGKTEQIRRERQQLDRVATAVASGASTIEAISAVANQPPQFGTGIQGILQRIAGPFQPSPGGGIGRGIQEAIIGRALTPPKVPTIAGQRAAEAARTGAVPGTPEFERIAGGPTKPTKRKGFSFTELAAIGKSIPKTLDGINKEVGRTKIIGRDKRAQTDLVKAYKAAALEAGYETWTEDQQKQFDRKWDRLARAKWRPRKAISKETDKEINVGWNPNSQEVKAARKELKTGTKAPTPITDTDVRLQAAPDIKLDPIWPKLSKDQKEKVWTAFQAGRSSQEILDALKADGVR